VSLLTLDFRLFFILLQINYYANIEYIEEFTQLEEDVDLRRNDGEPAASLHAQAQAPDDPFHDQDSQYLSLLCQDHAHLPPGSRTNLNQMLPFSSLLPPQDHPSANTAFTRN